MTLDRSFDMPQSGVTSVRSWYLTSFVILSFYCLSVCLTLLTVSNANKIFLNGEYRGFWVLLLRAERRGLYFVALAAVRCRFTPTPSVFRTVRIACLSINSTNFTHVIIARESMIILTLPRIFVDILPCHGIDLDLGYTASPYKVG